MVDGGRCQLVVSTTNSSSTLGCCVELLEIDHFIGFLKLHSVLQQSVCNVVFDLPDTYLFDASGRLLVFPVTCGCSGKSLHGRLGVGVTLLVHSSTMGMASRMMESTTVRDQRSC